MTPDPVRDLLSEVRASAFTAGRHSVRWSWRSFRVGVVVGLVLAWLLIFL
jgi:hypothetical protein